MLFDCQTCGACCAHSAEWPRFTTESEEEIARIPASLVDPSDCGMLCEDDRCAALDGIVGIAVRCTIHADRPHVCRACEPGDEECLIAREAIGLPVPGEFA